MRLTLVLLAALCVPVAFAQDAAPLKRVMKEGDAAKYSLRVETEVGGAAIVYSAKVLEKVTKIKDDGSYIVSSEQQDATLEMNGNSSPAPGGVGGATTTTFAADGRVLEIQGDGVDEAAYRMSNVQSFLFPKDPVKVGTKWEADLKGEKGKSEVPVHATYEIVGSEKVGKHECFKVTFETKETSGDLPATAKGTIWIDATTGINIKYEADWTNAPIAGYTISGKVKMELVE